MAEAGDAESQAYIGMTFFYGDGVRRDFREAAKWYRLAADQGHAFAQIELGKMHVNGLGVALDLVEAYSWFALAAHVSAGKCKDQQKREAAAKLRDILAGVMTQEQLSSAQILIERRQVQR